jgi:hypothetical protein
LERDEARRELVEAAWALDRLQDTIVELKAMLTFETTQPVHSGFVTARTSWSYGHEPMVWAVSAARWDCPPARPPVPSPACPAWSSRPSQDTCWWSRGARLWNPKRGSASGWLAKGRRSPVFVARRSFRSLADPFVLIHDPQDRPGIELAHEYSRWFQERARSRILFVLHLRDGAAL